MKKLEFRQFVPHLIAIGIFLLITLIFCKPALESGVVLKQSDATGWEGMARQSFQYKEQHGKFPLWVVSMFSGMPGYQVAMEGDWSPLAIIDQAFQLWLPQPMNFFFLACICFYFMCLCFGVRPYAAIAAALGFAYCSFSPIIISAGHNTQMLALAYAPAVIGSVMLVFNRRYILGFALTALFTALQIGQGHQQISYYLFIILFIMGIAWLIRMIRTGETVHVAKSLSLIVIAGIIGIAVNALTLLTVADFADHSKRGGQLVLDQSQEKAGADGKTKGLTKEYAFQWSYGVGETYSLMFPGVKGYGLHFAERDGETQIFPKIDEDSKVISYLSEDLGVPVDPSLSGYLSQKVYWGNQPFTNGPVYLGAIICFLFIAGMFLLDGRHKWWILITSVLAIMLSWGSNFASFNNIVFDIVPLYNKFRVPTMTLVIPQILFPLMAALVLSRLADGVNEGTWKRYRQALMATGLVFISALGYYAMSDFSDENPKRTSKFNQVYKADDPSMSWNAELNTRDLLPGKDNQLYEEMIMNFRGAPEARKQSREIVSALQKDRASMFFGDILRSLLFVVIAAALIGLYIKNKATWLLMIAGVSLTSTIDLVGFGMHYLNDKSYAAKEDYESSEFPMSTADQQILSDKDPHFRVFNMAGGDPFQESKTSYYHKSIGGYHPAKLGIYDDLIAHQLSGRPNPAVINMLNAKYVIQRQGNDVMAFQNPEALGNAWFVKGIRIVNGASEEMKALTSLNTKDSAVVDKAFAGMISGISPADSGATIRLTSFDNDKIIYSSNSTGNNAAIFSEVYYKDWKAYIDGREVPIFRANYVLRGIVVPPGVHTIEFRFEPSAYFTGRTISTVSTWLLMALVALGLAYSFLRKKKVPVA